MNGYMVNSPPLFISSAKSFWRRKRTRKLNKRYLGVKKGCEQPVSVFADKEKIARVLINLIENAIKYGKHGGSIIASIYNTDDRHALIEISDDGMGIAEEHLPRVFERFYRTDPGRSRNVGGTGLGLAWMRPQRMGQ